MALTQSQINFYTSALYGLVLSQKIRNHFLFKLKDPNFQEEDFLNYVKNFLGRNPFADSAAAAGYNLPSDVNVNFLGQQPLQSSEVTSFGLLFQRFKDETQKEQQNSKDHIIKIDEALEIVQQNEKMFIEQMGDFGKKFEVMEQLIISVSKTANKLTEIVINQNAKLEKVDKLIEKICENRDFDCSNLSGEINEQQNSEL